MRLQKYDIDGDVDVDNNGNDSTTILAHVA